MQNFGTGRTVWSETGGTTSALQGQPQEMARPPRPIGAPPGFETLPPSAQQQWMAEQLGETNPPPEMDQLAGLRLEVAELAQRREAQLADLRASLDAQYQAAVGRVRLVAPQPAGMRAYA